jgi:hypothetical protein
MCWNAEVSLNTFLFSSFVMLLIIYNNNYTQYKVQFIEGLNNIWAYIFMFSFIFMQLIEFFIWKNINNPGLNSFFSILATILLLIQPIASIMLLQNEMRLYFLIPYLLLIIPIVLYNFFTKKINSSVSKFNHLQWNTLLFPGNPITIFIWLFFFLFPLLYRGSTLGFLFSSLTLLVVMYNFYKDRSFGSMWCWVVNSLMIYFAAYLLFYLPFFK